MDGWMDGWIYLFNNITPARKLHQLLGVVHTFCFIKQCIKNARGYKTV